jgi:hypothetical protein
MLHSVAGAVKGAIERAMPMEGNIDEERESLRLMVFLEKLYRTPFSRHQIFVEHFLEARSISHGV